jgi:potassium efflux system protein
MSTVFRWLGYVLLFVILQTHPLLVQAEKSLESIEVSLTKVREKINTIKNKPNIDEELSLRILNPYYAAEDNFDELLILDQQIRKERSQLKKLPTEIQQLEKRIKKAEKNLKNKKTENFSLAPIDELEQRLVFERSNLNLLMSSISQLEIQRAEQLKRPQQIREQMAEIRNEQIKSRHEQSLVTSLVSNKQELLARQTQLDSRLRKLNAMLTQLDLENIAYPLRDQAQTLSLQLLNLQSEPITTLVNALDNFLTDQRQQEISDEQAELIQAQKELTGKHLLIQEVTKENIRYKQLLLDTNTKLEKYLDLKSGIETRYKQLEKDYQSAEQKINLAGLSPALGNLLREQRRNLPLAQTYQNKFDHIQKDIALASLELFQMDEVKKSLSDMDQALLIRMTAYVAQSSDENEKSKLEIELRSLLINQKKLLLKLGSVYSDFSRTLADVDFSLQQLVTLGAKFNHYLNQRLLWVPSAPVIDQNYLLEIFDSVVWLVQISGWQQAVEDIKNSVQIHLFLASLVLSVISSLLWFRKKIKLNLQTLLTSSSSLYADHFNFTYYGLFYVFLLALPIPLLVFCSGWFLQINEMSTSFSFSVAQGLIAVTIPLLIIQFFYYLFKPKGVMQSLFGWKEHKIQLLYRLLKWLRFVVVPAMFLIAMFADDTYSVQSYSLGRMALIITMLAIAYLFHRLAHPVNGLAKDYYQQNPGSWICRLRFIWYGSLVLTPLVIIGFAIAGYYQSALELQHKLVIVLRLMFFTTLFHEIVIRWMVLANRQLALQNVRQKRKLHEQADTKDKGDAITINSEEDMLLDIPKINEQSKTLLQAVISVILLVGVWLTVKDILPAFSIFDQVVLWQHISLSNGQEVLQSITLVNVFFCLLYLLLTLIFVKNFPGLIDLLFARRYSMAAGSRYALIQLTRYAVIAITFIAMSNELGGSWSQVQWLVAAISVGLGFGLQEIFANMVSGIILLFERPIRVGDTVTVGDVTGKVCRIQMRATTIIDWDQKELIVPNKTFITDKLINWSLTDTITRVVIPVGIAYDSDEELVIRLFKQVIEESPLVLDDPEPSVYFLGFGDSSLDFELRVFVRDLNDRFPVTDDLHRRIRRVFKEHNIEIPFPQRDLHIRSTVQPSILSENSV